MAKLYSVVIYIPDSHLEAVKQALFEAGAGQLGDYEQCCWQVQGRGQFAPNPGAKPFIGQVGRLEQVDEWRVELICKGEVLKQAIQAMLTAHPYEEPAYQITALVSLADVLA